MPMYHSSALALGFGGTVKKGEKAFVVVVFAAETS
jgi:hypothetical protein